MNYQSQSRTLFLVFVFLVSVSSAYAQSVKPAEQNPTAAEAEFDEKNWKIFSSADGGFSALFPTQPEANQQQIESVLGRATLHTFIARTKGEYGVSYVDYLSPIEGTTTSISVMDAVVDSGVQGVNGRLIDQHDIQYENHLGRVYRVEFGGGYVMNAKMLVVKNRLYLVTATTYGSKAPAIVARAYESFATKFLGSFKLTSTVEKP